VPGQAFYIRTYIFHIVKQSLVDLGVRNNDLLIVLRGNRYNRQEVDVKHLSPTMFSWLLATCPDWVVMAVWVSTIVFIGFPFFMVFDELSSVYLAAQWHRRYVLNSSIDVKKML
jgi:hypothetical protein